MISLQVGQLEMMEKEATPEKPKQMGNKEKMRRKEENWEVVTVTMFMITTTMFARVYHNSHYLPGQPQ